MNDISAETHATLPDAQQLQPDSRGPVPAIRRGTCRY
jgi:hypothetical protein